MAMKPELLKAFADLKLLAAQAERNLADLDAAAAELLATGSAAPATAAEFTAVHEAALANAHRACADVQDRYAKIAAAVTAAPVGSQVQ
jgi:hypothetical protein